MISPTEEELIGDKLAEESASQSDQASGGLSTNPKAKKEAARNHNTGELYISRPLDNPSSPTFTTSTQIEAYSELEVSNSEPIFSTFPVVVLATSSVFQAPTTMRRSDNPRALRLSLTSLGDFSVAMCAPRSSPLY
jgi:hypothetical protein